MFSQHGYGLESGSSVATAVPVNGSARRWREFDLAPDLGSRIGTLQWYRGVATCGALVTATLFLAPGFENPIYAYVPPEHSAAAPQAMRAQAIGPLATGAATGYRTAPTRAVAALADTPERPTVNLPVTLASGGSLVSSLRRSGVGSEDASHVAQLLASAVSLGEIAPGTQADLTLGRRIDKSQPRPLELLSFRARFDLNVKITRAADGALALEQVPIAIDHTPLRIRTRVGASLYRSARAAGAPAKGVEAFIRAMASRTSIASLGPDAEVDMIFESARAETGEVRLGDLLYAGVSDGGSKVQLVRWDADGSTEWYDGSGKGERKGAMTMPVAGHITSTYGVRVHPVLGYKRMHKGLDIGAPWGSPIYAPMDGVVAFAGRKGGYGNFVKLSHAGGLATGFGHMSRFAVSSGARVRRGQVIGYVGSTGMSTGPHVHYELYRNGVAVNPASVSFTVQKALSGGQLAAFRSKLNGLLAVPVATAPAAED